MTTAPTKPATLKSLILTFGSSVLIYGVAIYFGYFWLTYLASFLTFFTAFTLGAIYVVLPANRKIIARGYASLVPDFTATQLMISVLISSVVFAFLFPIMIGLCWRSFYFVFSKKTQRLATISEYHKELRHIKKQKNRNREWMEKEIAEFGKRWAKVEKTDESLREDS